MQGLKTYLSRQYIIGVRVSPLIKRFISMKTCTILISLFVTNVIKIINQVLNPRQVCGA